MENLGVIYRVTCLPTGKCYIGQTKNFKTRKLQHERAKDDYVFHKAIRKYGKDSFVWEILEECPYDKLDEREVFWIAEFDSYNNGYNSTQGGDNADSLLNWKKNNKDKELEYAKNGLKFANAYWDKHPEEKKKQLLIAQGKARESVSRKVRCIELNLVFNSISDAERWSMTSDNPHGVKILHQSISKVCKGQRHTTGGYHWEYVD